LDAKERGNFAVRRLREKTRTSLTRFFGSCTCYGGKIAPEGQGLVRGGKGTIGKENGVTQNDSVNRARNKKKKNWPVG